MALIDSLRAGAGFINDLDQNRILHAIAPYQGGLAAAKLYEANTNNKYLDEKDRLDNLRAGLANIYQGKVNQFYAPNIQSEIANRNALTRGQNIDNQFAPQRLGLANIHAEQQNQTFIPDTMSQINSRNASTEGQNIDNTSEAEYRRAQINNMNAQATMRNTGGGAGMGVGQKEMMGFQHQLQIDNPNWDANKINQAASAYLAGGDSLPDGTKLSPLSGLAQSSLAQIQKRNSTAAVQNQAVNMDVLASDVNDIDITPVTKFVGLKGRMDYARYTADMAMGNDVPQEFRDYKAFQDVTSNFAMDALRKGFGTSVVPDYVYKTLGKASNPGSTWWFDPKQVQTEWKATTDWINKNAQKYKTKATQGVGASVDQSRAPASSGSSGMMRVSSVDGKQHAEIPSQNIDAFLKDHPAWKKVT